MIKDKLKLKRLERISSKLGNPKNYRKCIQDLVKFFPFAYHNILKRPEFTPLAKWIVDSTRFLDYDCGMNTRVKYVVDGKKEIYRCHCCNKPIRTTMKPLIKTKKFWCSTACQGQDPYLKAKLSSSHKKIIKKWTTRANLPPEAKANRKIPLLPKVPLPHRKAVPNRNSPLLMKVNREKPLPESSFIKAWHLNSSAEANPPRNITLPL